MNSHLPSSNIKNLLGCYLSKSSSGYLLPLYKEVIGEKVGHIISLCHLQVFTLLLTSIAIFSIYYITRKEGRENIVSEASYEIKKKIETNKRRKKIKSCSCRISILKVVSNSNLCKDLDKNTFATQGD